MALLQALLALLGRSAGKILSAIFGWSVRALFGSTSGAEKYLLTLLVASAALWPILLIGIAFPRFAALALTFVPLPKSIPDAPIRLVWIALAVVVPALVGIALAMKARPGTAAESLFMRLCRGLPATIAVAAAFWISLIGVPAMRLVSMVRKQSEGMVPLVTDAAGYERVARRLLEALNARGFELKPAEPGFWMQAPMRVMRTLGGAALRRYVPQRFAFYAGPDLQVALYPSSLLLRGSQARITFAHGIGVEALTSCDVFQTTDPRAQEIEKRIRRTWREMQGGTGARVADASMREIARGIAELPVAYDDWQILYRQALQLSRAWRGEPQLLDLLDEDAAQVQQRSELRGAA